MDCQKEIVLRNTVLWADNPIKKIMDGMRRGRYYRDCSHCRIHDSLFAIHYLFKE
jgi:hypothetical protein